MLLLKLIKQYFAAPMEEGVFNPQKELQIQESIAGNQYSMHLYIYI